MTVDPYLIEGTETLRNKAGITDAGQLARFEARMSLARISQLESGEVIIPGRWDLDHLLAYHRHIFGDVYDWAGTLRTVDIAKGTTAFCHAPFIASSAVTTFGDLERKSHLRELDRPQFVAEAAHLLSEVNVLHPAREGNGRSQRAFLAGLAAQAGWRLDWSQVGAEENVAASIAGYEGDEWPMARMLDRITSQLDPPAVSEQHPDPAGGPFPSG